MIHIGHRVVIGVDHLRFGTAAINTNTFRLPLRKAARVTLGVVKVRTFGMQNDQMLAIRVAPQRLLHFVYQQHIIYRLATVTWLRTNLLTISNVVCHRVAVEPHFALHSVEIRTES